MKGSGGLSARRQEGGGYAPQLQKGTWASSPPTSVGASSVGPFRFSLSPINTHLSTGQGTNVLIFNYIVCAESIMAPPGNGSCRQRGVRSKLLNECISRALCGVCVYVWVWGVCGAPALFMMPSSPPLSPFLQEALRNSRPSGQPPSGALVKELESKEG